MNKKSTLLLVAFFVLLSAGLSAQAAFTQATDTVEMMERGITLEQSGNLNDAIEIYRQILAVDGKNTLAQIRLAKLLSWQLKLDEALYILDRLLENYPDISEAVFRKAQILSWQKKYDEAIKLFIRYLELEKEDPDGLTGLARTYFWSGDYENAIIYFKKSIEAGYYNETENRLNLAKLYLNLNNPEDAKKEIELVFQKDPQNKEAKELYATLPLFMKYEASLSLKGELYPDSFGFEASPFFLYRPSKIWDFQAEYDLYALEGKSDSTISAGATFKGIKRLSLGTVFHITPDPDYNEAVKIVNFASYSINRKAGTGIAVESLFYGNNENQKLDEETLFILKPSFSYFFTDISNATVQYISYLYKSGFSTSAVSLKVVVEYWNSNPLNIALTYGGDYETMDSSRTIFEAGGGLSWKFSNNFELGISYNHVESEYSKVNQFSVIPMYRW